MKVFQGKNITLTSEKDGFSFSITEWKNKIEIKQGERGCRISKEDIDQFIEVLKELLP